MDVLTSLHPDVKTSWCPDVSGDLRYCWFEVPRKVEAMNHGLDHPPDRTIAKSLDGGIAELKGHLA